MGEPFLFHGVLQKETTMSQDIEKTFCPWCRQLFEMDLGEVGEIKPCPNCKKPVECARRTCRKVDEVKYKHGLLPKRVGSTGQVDPYGAEERPDDSGIPSEIGGKKVLPKGIWAGTRELTSVTNVFRFFLIFGLISVTLHVAARLFLDKTTFVPAGSEWLLWGPLLLWYLFFASATNKNYGWRWFGIAWLIFAGGTAAVSLGLSQAGILDVVRQTWLAAPIALGMLLLMLLLPFTRKYIPYIVGVAMAGIPLALIAWGLIQLKLFWP